MAFSLKHIPQLNALEIKQNGKNSSQAYSRFMHFLDGLPAKDKRQKDNYTYMINHQHFDEFYDRFGPIITMTQTVGSIRGTEKPNLPAITYQNKHLGKMRLPPFPFQQIGIEFLLSVKTGIIGDEMGLGKSATGLGAANELLQENKIKKVLIIVPASLKFQWEGEVKKFTPHHCVVVDGTKKQRLATFEAFRTSANISMCIIGYEAMRNDIEELKAIDIDCIIMDEAQKVKNRKTKLYQAIIQLNPEYKFCLTGTPMQNRPDEIFALMSWINKDVLGGVTKFNQEHTVIGEKFGRRYVLLGYKNLDSIRDRISPYLLRRTKKEVAPDLPKMLYSTIRVDMSKPQAKLYQAITDDFKFLQQNLSDFYQGQSDADAKSGKTSKDEDKILGFNYMMQAVSDHPMLLAQGKSKMAQKYLPLVRKCPTSPKLEALIEMLVPVIERGSKVVIFSQYTTMLALIRERIISEFNQEPYLIQGSVSSRERQNQVENFKASLTRQIMLLSDAGNFGLNLQCADTLVNYDQPFNPATLAQRNSRIHRLDSDFETVDIVNLITNDTIDEQIERALERKEELGNSLIERSDEEKSIMKNLLEDKLEE